MDWLFFDGKLQSIWIPCPGTGHIELSMAENWTPQPDPHVLQRLALRLVDGGGEGDANWKLSSGPIKRVTSWFGDELNPWDKHFLVIADQLAHQQHIVECSLEDQLGTVAQALLGTNVPK